MEIATNRKPDSPTGPDFRHVRDWIFDLDNTLYRADCGVFARIEARMTDFVAAALVLERGEARAVQKTLYRQYGTTLNGMMQLHGTDPEDYLAFVHDIDLGDLVADPGLRFALERLPGRRYVFTNGCRHHAGRILARLRMEDLFEAVWDIRAIGFLPKPDLRGYEQVIATAAIDPARAAMFDDVALNLVPARALGMTTVWLKTALDGTGPDLQSAAATPHIDFETGDLAAFLNSIRI